MTIKVTKTQISFRSRYVFAMASLPYRRMKDWPKEYLMLSFGLNYRKDSPRIVQAVEAYPNRWTHHVIVERTEYLDDELLGCWLCSSVRRATAFSLSVSRRLPRNI